MTLFEEQRILRLTVSQFAERFRKWIERRPELNHIAIVGEISEWKRQPNGNVYFSLKDDRAVLRCFAFQKQAATFPEVSDGIAAVATGSIGVLERRSEYQLRVFELAPLGVGAMAAKVEALRKRLQAEGIFEPERKRAFPPFPRRVALVSARGKGAGDFETTLRERAPNVTTIFVETRVQGEGAELDIADALERASKLDVDAIVLLRGGGTYEDRYPFNTEVVVRAILRSRHAVVTAIGHTGDHHLADDVADAVFKTPTAAAEHITGSWSHAARRLSHQRALLARVIDLILARASQRSDGADQALSAAMERCTSRLGRRLLELSARVERQSPRYRLEQRARRLGIERERFDAARERFLSQRCNALALVASRLTSADPEKPLERGYAIVTRAGRALYDARDVAPGEEIAARLHHGSLHARVERVSGDD